MSFFHHSAGADYYTSNSQIRSQPVLRSRGHKGQENKKDEDRKDENGDNEAGGQNKEPSKLKKQDEIKDRKIHGIIGNPALQVFPPDKETAANTLQNALIYDTSKDSIDRYRKDNDSSDLLGRLYYDDYSSDTIESPELLSPIISPAMGPSISNDYFSLTNERRNLSSSSLSKLSFTSSSSLAQRPPLAHRVSNERGIYFERGVSFDTPPKGTNVSLTLKAKHPEFKFRRNNKTFLAGFSNDLESVKALEWLFDEMIVNGDTIIVLQALEEKNHRKIEKSAAQKLFEKFQSLNKHAKKISLVFEISIGKPKKLLESAIEEYCPSMMIVGTHDYQDQSGTHHSKGLQLFSKSSTSKHFLECANVPVIVVKPTYEYFEDLEPISDSKDHFSSLLESLDLNRSHFKEKHNFMSKINRGRSTVSSRSSSSLTLNELNNGNGSAASLKGSELEQRGRNARSLSAALSSSDRSQSRSRSRSAVKRLSKIFG